MKNILNLTKIYFKETLYGTLNLSKKKKRTQSIIFFLFLTIFIAFYFGYILYQVGKMLSAVGYERNVLLFGLMISLFMVLLLSLNDTQGYLYKARDYESVAALPIKTRYVITARYLSAYLISFVYTSIIAIPTFVVYFIFSDISFVAILFALLSLFLLPAFSQLISCLTSWLINAISSKMQNKNIARTIFSLLFTVLIAIFIYQANTDMLTSTLSQEPALWMKIVFANVYFLQMSIVNANFLYFLVFFGISIVYASLGVIILLLGYNKINSALLTNKAKKNKKSLNYVKSSVGANLIKKEATTFFNNPVYCMNGIMGPIMAVVITIICISIYNKNAMYGDLSVKIFLAIQMFSLGMVVGIAPTTAVSLSMEGNKLQLLKSLPITYNKVVSSKVLFNVILLLPITILSDILFACFVPIKWYLILVIVYHICAVITSSILGMILNLKFPKLNWTTEAQAVKQGASMLITMFVDMIVAMLPMILYFAFMDSLMAHTILFLSVVIALYVAIFILLLVLLQTKGKKLYDNIN